MQERIKTEYQIYKTVLAKKGGGRVGEGWGRVGEGGGELERRRREEKSKRRENIQTNLAGCVLACVIMKKN